MECGSLLDLSLPKGSGGLKLAASTFSLDSLQTYTLHRGCAPV
jgi:hypothetical protein